MTILLIKTSKLFFYIRDNGIFISSDNINSSKRINNKKKLVNTKDFNLKSNNNSNLDEKALMRKTLSKDGKSTIKQNNSFFKSINYKKESTRELTNASQYSYLLRNLPNSVECYNNESKSREINLSNNNLKPQKYTNINNSSKSNQIINEKNITNPHYKSRNTTNQIFGKTTISTTLISHSLINPANMKVIKKGIITGTVRNKLFYNHIKNGNYNNLHKTICNNVCDKNKLLIQNNRNKFKHVPKTVISLKKPFSNLVLSTCILKLANKPRMLKNENSPVNNYDLTQSRQKIMSLKKTSEIQKTKLNPVLLMKSNNSYLNKYQVDSTKYQRKLRDISIIK